MGVPVHYVGMLVAELGEHDPVALEDAARDLRRVGRGVVRLSHPDRDVLDGALHSLHAAPYPANAAVPPRFFGGRKLGPPKTRAYSSVTFVDSAAVMAATYAPIAVVSATVAAVLGSAIGWIVAM